MLIQVVSRLSGSVWRWNWTWADRTVGGGLSFHRNTACTATEGVMGPFVSCIISLLYKCCHILRSQPGLCGRTVERPDEMFFYWFHKKSDCSLWFYCPNHFTVCMCGTITYSQAVRRDGRDQTVSLCLQFWGRSDFTCIFVNGFYGIKKDITYQQQILKLCYKDTLF